MKSGLVIYAKSVDKLSRFYSQVLPLTHRDGDATYAMLENEAFELVLLETPTSKGTSDSQTARENTAIKPTFFLDEALGPVAQRIEEMGGKVQPPKSWTFSGRQVCDACDCEGNIFQLRLPKGV